LEKEGGDIDFLSLIITKIGKIRSIMPFVYLKFKVAGQKQA